MFHSQISNFCEFMLTFLIFYEKWKENRLIELIFAFSIKQKENYLFIFSKFLSLMQMIFNEMRCEVDR